MATIKFVCDTSALVAYWRGEKGGGVVESCLETGGLVMHEVNVSEFCFTMPRKLPELFSPRFAQTWLEESGIDTVQGFDRAWANRVADIRTAAPALNIGDGVAVALAAALNVPVLTSEKAFREVSAFARIELIR